VASPRSALYARAKAAGLDPVGIHAWNEVDPQAIVRLAALLRRRRPAILHLHTSHAHSIGLIASVLAPPLRLVVSRRVDFSIYRPGTFHLNGIKYRAGVHRYIAVSGAVAARMESDGVPAGRISVVRSGIDPAKFSPRPPADPEGILRELGLPPRLPLIVSIGALADHKGHRYLIEAAGRVLGRRDAAFVVAGTGPRRRSLARLAERSGIGGRFRLPGFLPDIGRILAGASVFAFPSLQEGLGTSLLDALLLERPVVASRAGGIPEIVEDRVHGLLVPPRDAEALAAGLLESLDLPEEARARARRGRDRVLAEFSVDRMVEETLEVYRDVLGDREKKT
jgi:glycosyltransferase involved in cell wall biosynthesis